MGFDLTGPGALVDAACTALVDGLDSPALRDLAGASPKDRLSDVMATAETALDELRVPWPGTVPPGHRVAAGGGVVRRSGTDTLRLEIAPHPSGLEVRVHVNDVDVLRESGLTGVDPSGLFGSDSPLAVGGEVPLAICECGYCDRLVVTVIRDGDLVHWEWPSDVRLSPGVTFTATDYDAELARRATGSGQAPGPGRRIS